MPVVLYCTRVVSGSEQECWQPLCRFSYRILFPEAKAASRCCRASTLPLLNQDEQMGKKKCQVNLDDILSTSSSSLTMSMNPSRMKMNWQSQSLNMRGDARSDKSTSYSQVDSKLSQKLARASFNASRLACFSNLVSLIFSNLFSLPSILLSFLPFCFPSSLCLP